MDWWVSLVDKMDDIWQLKMKLAMEGERSEYTRDKDVDEKSPLLSEQGDSSNAVEDRSRASNSSRYAQPQEMKEISIAYSSFLK